MHTGRRSLALRRASTLLRALALGAVLPLALAAQQEVESSSRTIRNPDGSAGRVIPRRGFSLFGASDMAVTGMKQVGQQGWALTNYGPCGADGYRYTGDCGHVQTGGMFRSLYFEIALVFGTPQHEFRKIRSVHPRADSVVRGGGYNLLWNAPLLTFRGEVAASDNSLGSVFSGAQSTGDGSCRDIRAAINGFVAAGATLLPMSDCPETWGAMGFRGPREIPAESWLALKSRLGADFDWQYWRATPDLQRGLLGSFSTWGLMTDHTSEALEAYGSVTPRSNSQPTWDGYPLGLDFRFEAFTSTAPWLANAVIYQVTVVNNSRDVYGTGIDYDSLYGGLEVGFYHPVDQANTYWEPGRNAVLSANRGIHPACNGTRQITGTPSCGTVQGFNRGATGMVFLKSPIGDMRNKLLSRPGSPFHDPSSPAVDDTITLNHGHKCGYGACYSGNVEVSERRRFGMMSSTGANVLDGRSANDLTSSGYYYTFRPHDFPARTGRFNHMVPGNWDYDDDGVQDTIFFDTCHDTLNNANNVARGRTRKCVSTWSDSMPGGFVNAYGNMFGMETAGPFALKAGDTTAFVIAFVGGPDSASIERTTDAVIAGYLDFWKGPQPPTPPRVTAVNTVPGGLESSVRLTLSDEPQRFVDEFLLTWARELETSNDAAQVRLRTLNPELAAQIRARAAAGVNVGAILVYKSCDEGQTFTSDADCDGNPVVDGNGQPVAGSWQPYRVLEPGPDGRLPVEFTDENVIGGRKFLYVFVPQSRGLTVTVSDSVGGALVTRELAIAQPQTAPLSTTGPNALTVYVPISHAVGAGPATFTVSREGAASTVPIDVRLWQSPAPGSYVGTFGNRFVIVDSVRRATGAVTTTVTVQRHIPVATRSGVELHGGVVTFSETFRGPGPIAVAPALGTSRRDSTVTDEWLVRTDTLTVGAGAFLLSRAGAPLYISGSATPVAFYGHPGFPRFTVDVRQGNAGEFVAGSERLVRPAGDTVRGAALGAGVGWREDTTGTRVRALAGEYAFTFAGDPYGPGAPFTLDLANVPLTQEGVRQSLAARPSAATTDTSAATLAAVRAALGRSDVELVAASLPFTASNLTFGRAVTFAMAKRTSVGGSNTILLGSGADTVRVAIDSTTWVPGDLLVMLETMAVDSVANGAVVIDPASGEPFQVQRRLVTWAPAILGCDTPRPSCNPVAAGSPGSTGYLAYGAGTKLLVDFGAGFAPGSRFAVEIVAPATGSFTSTARSRIRVVPNPYVVQDLYEAGPTLGGAKVYFTHVPPEGLLRVYTVSGRPVMQRRWTAGDLVGTGDLPWDLRTLDGGALSSGLYIWTIDAPGAGGQRQLARGKLVVVR